MSRPGFVLIWGKLSLAGVCILLLSACAAIRPEPPEVQLAGLELTNLSLSHANFLATLQLYNPNGVDLDVEGLDFTLFLNDLRIAHGKTAKAFLLPAEDTAEAALRLSTSYLNLLQLSGRLQGQSELNFRVAGEVEIGGFGIIGTTIPIDHEGTLPLTGSLNQLVPGRMGQPQNPFGTLTTPGDLPLP